MGPPVATPVELTETAVGLLLTQEDPTPAGLPTNVVELSAHTALAPAIVAGGLTVTIILPLIVLVQPVAVTVPTIVYVPAAVTGGKHIPAPVPATGAPTGVEPFISL